MYSFYQPFLRKQQKLDEIVIFSSFLTLSVAVQHAHTLDKSLRFSKVLGLKSW